jgi:DNA-directed RNA polymerase subunit RPC12/RpoP
MVKKCSKCGKETRFLERYVDESQNLICEDCWKELVTKRTNEREEIRKKSEEEARKKLEEIIAKAPKIKCPYCEQWFPKLTNEQYKDSAELNVLKWAIVPAWGLAGSLKNKPFIECPHCKMKIMQG